MRRQRLVNRGSHSSADGGTCNSIESKALASGQLRAYGLLGAICVQRSCARCAVRGGGDLPINHALARPALGQAMPNDRPVDVADLAQPLPRGDDPPSGALESLRRDVRVVDVKIAADHPDRLGQRIERALDNALAVAHVAQRPVCRDGAVEIGPQCLQQGLVIGRLLEGAVRALERHQGRRHVAVGRADDRQRQDRVDADAPGEVVVEGRAVKIAVEEDVGPRDGQTRPHRILL
ncbi:MAG TPA: hypothetical protein PL196_06635 [Burkholderiaceae bacterium]|nr:hypothetical protein [Burkholderiaceae bacterium]